MRASQLAKQHGHKLAPTGEAPRVPLGLVLLDRLFEIPARKKLQHLRKNAAYFVHRLSLLRLYWFFRNPIQPIRGSAFHSHSRFPGPPRWNHSAILDSNDILSSAVIGRPGHYEYKLLTELEAEIWLKQSRFVSRVG